MIFCGMNDIGSRIRDVLPQKFPGLIEKEKDDVDVGRLTKEELVKSRMWWKIKKSG